MRKIILVVCLLVVMAGRSFGSTMQEIEEMYQQGLQFAQGQMVDKAMEQFEKIVAADPAGLEKEYYVETYSETYFFIGLLKSQAGNIEQANEAYKRAIQIFPNHKRALYFLAYNLITQGEIAEARYYYKKAKAMGYETDPQLGKIVGDVLGQFEEKETTVDYRSFSEGDMKVHIQGNPIGDEELIRDAIAAVERINMVAGKKMFSDAAVEYVRNKEEETILIEKWVVGLEQDKAIYWVEYDLTPPEGFLQKIMITVSEKEPL